MGNIIFICDNNNVIGKIRGPMSIPDIKRNVKLFSLDETKFVKPRNAVLNLRDHFDFTLRKEQSDIVPNFLNLEYSCNTKVNKPLTLQQSLPSDYALGILVDNAYFKTIALILSGITIKASLTEFITQYKIWLSAITDYGFTYGFIPNDVLSCMILVETFLINNGDELIRVLYDNIIGYTEIVYIDLALSLQNVVDTQTASVANCVVIFLNAACGNSPIIRCTEYDVAKYTMLPFGKRLDESYSYPTENGTMTVRYNVMYSITHRVNYTSVCLGKYFDVRSANSTYYLFQTVTFTSNKNKLISSEDLYNERFVTHVLRRVAVSHQHAQVSRTKLSLVSVPVLFGEGVTNYSHQSNNSFAQVALIMRECKTVGFLVPLPVVLKGEGLESYLLSLIKANEKLYQEEL